VAVYKCEKCGHEEAHQEENVLSYEELLADNERLRNEIEELVKDRDYYRKMFLICG